MQLQTSASWIPVDDVQTVAPVLISGTAWATNPGLRPLPGFQPRVLAVRGFPGVDELAVDLSDDELFALDRATDGNGLTINLKLQATLLRAEPTIHPVVGQEITMQIPPGRWLELLEGAGVAVGITLRIPSPLTETGAD